MADNINILDKDGNTRAVATDQIAGVDHQRVKLVVGADGVAVDHDSTHPLYVNVLDVVPGTGVTSLGKAEGDAASSGDTGVTLLVVRRDSAGPGSAADGDYAALEHRRQRCAPRRRVNVGDGVHRGRRRRREPDRGRADPPPPRHPLRHGGVGGRRRDRRQRHQQRTAPRLRRDRVDARRRYPHRRRRRRPRHRRDRAARHAEYGADTKVRQDRRLALPAPTKSSPPSPRRRSGCCAGR